MTVLTRFELLPLHRLRSRGYQLARLQRRPETAGPLAGYARVYPSAVWRQSRIGRDVCVGGVEKTLAQLFEVPASWSQLWLRIYPVPGPQRARLEVAQASDRTAVLYDAEHREFWTWRLARLCRGLYQEQHWLGRQVWYLGLEYV